jgi:V/A-type H+-transporting ATPase subunit E
MSVSDKNALAGLASYGVEALIERLRDEGVAAGRAEAEQIEARARERAAETLREAELQAKRIVAEATREADATRNGGKEAVRIAMRDTVLQLKAELTQRFNVQVRRLITKEMRKEAFLQELIREIVGRAREEAALQPGAPVEVILPRELVGLEDLRRNPLELREGSLSHFVLAVASDVLEEGVTFTVAEDEASGIRLYLKDKDVEIDLTDAKVAEHLLAHLQPRFRAILEGTVK